MQVARSRFLGSAEISHSQEMNDSSFTPPELVFDGPRVPPSAREGTVRLASQYATVLAISTLRALTGAVCRVRTTPK